MTNKEEICKLMQDHFTAAEKSALWGSLDSAVRQADDPRTAEAWDELKKGNRHTQRGKDREEADVGLPCRIWPGVGNKKLSK